MVSLSAKSSRYAYDAFGNLEVKTEEGGGQTTVTQTHYFNDSFLPTYAIGLPT